MKISTIQNKQNFCAHPDFMLLKEAYHITASSYFRRGQYYGSPDIEFKDVIKIFHRKFGRPTSTPQKVLIAGIGASEEPFSYLSVIQNISKDVKLDKIIDLYCVDLQSIPSKKALYMDSFYDFQGIPKFASESFIKESDKHGKYDYAIYRVKDEIFKYLWMVYNNRKKTKWETRIQDAITKYKSSQFDIISINNVLGYIANPLERENVIKNVIRCLKKGGIFITDPFRSDKYKSLNELKKCAEGIFEK